MVSIPLPQTVQRELLPTPTKSHYTYNLRDMGKVFLGLHFAPAGLEEPDRLIRLWANECLRVGLFNSRKAFLGSSWIGCTLCH